MNNGEYSGQIRYIPAYNNLKYLILDKLQKHELTNVKNDGSFEFYYALPISKDHQRYMRVSVLSSMYIGATLMEWKDE